MTQGQASGEREQDSNDSNGNGSGRAPPPPPPITGHHITVQEGAPAKSGGGGGACTVWVKEGQSVPTPLDGGLDDRVSDPRVTQALVLCKPARLCRCLHFQGSVYLPDKWGHGPLLTGKCSQVWERLGPSVAGVPKTGGSWGANHLPPDPLDFLGCIFSPLGSGNSARSLQVHQGTCARHACSCTMPHPTGSCEALATARMWGQG